MGGKKKKKKPKRYILERYFLRMSGNSVTAVLLGFMVKDLIRLTVQLSNCFCIHRFPKCLHFTLKTQCETIPVV